MEELIDDIKRRETILRWLQHKDMRNFKDLGRIFEKYQEKPVEFFNEVSRELGQKSS
jgi:hypothetical protein